MKNITLTEEELNEFLQVQEKINDITRLGGYYGRFRVLPFGFSDKFTIIVLHQKDNDLYNFITKEGTFLFAEWFDIIMTFSKEGVARALRPNGEVLKIDKNGKILSIWNE